MKTIVNARLVMEDGILENASICFDGRIRRICAGGAAEGEAIDAEGRMVWPGLIDLHMHGYCGYEFAAGSAEDDRAIAKALTQHGVTGFLVGYGSMPLERMDRATDAARAIMGNTGGARCHGTYIEGVFISHAKKGAHDPKLLRAPDTAFTAGYRDILRISIVAPELYPEYIDWCRENGIVCAMGHTDATYEEAAEGIRRGVTQATHLFNGMRGIHHRDAGAAGAALLSDSVNVELIADTVHVAKELHRMVYRMKGPDRILLITDSSLASGLKPGGYTGVDGRKFIVDELASRLTDGTLTGSAVPLYRGVLNFHRYSGVPLHECVRMASLNPARVLRADGETGSLTPGKRADLFMLDEDLQVACTFVDGECVYRRGDHVQTGL